MRLQRHGLTRASALAMATTMALSFGIFTPGVQAKGAIWLKTQQAATNPVVLHPSMATYRNHAYILSVHETTGVITSVYFTTNESGKWKSSLVSSNGPGGAYSQEFVGLAIDASQDKLYATWIYKRAFGKFVTETVLHRRCADVFAALEWTWSETVILMAR